MRRFDWSKTFSVLSKTLQAKGNLPQNNLHFKLLRNFSANKFPSPLPPEKEPIGIV